MASAQQIQADELSEKNLKRADGVGLTIFPCKALYTMRDQDDRLLANPDTCVVTNGDRIVCASKFEDALHYYPKATIDRSYETKFIYPGFIDPHLHIWLFQMCLNCEIINPDDWVFPWEACPGAKTREAYLKRVDELVKRRYENPESHPYGTEKFIFFGWHHLWHGEFNRTILDELYPNDAILIWSRSGHECIMNTKMFEMMKLDREKFKGNDLIYDNHCWETYWFQEDAIVSILANFLQVVMDPRMSDLVVARTKQMMTLGGITVGVDQGIQLHGAPLENFKKIEGKNVDKKPYDYYTIPEAYQSCNLFGVEKTLEIIESMQPEGDPVTTTKDGDLMILPKQLKLFTDGAAYSQLMRIRGGYTDGHQGQYMMRPENFQKVCEHFWDQDYQFHVHCNGDLGLQTNLDTLRLLNAKRPRADHRWTGHHLCVMSGDQAKQMVDLGMYASFNPSYVMLCEKYGEHGMTKDMADNLAAMGSCCKLGNTVSMHSDAPMAPPTPLALCDYAINRFGIETGRVCGPDNRISRFDAMSAITRAAAKTVQLEKQYGTIEAGKWANFTILDDDFFTVPEKKIKELYVYGTVLRGEFHQNTCSKEDYADRVAECSKYEVENQKIRDTIHKSGKDCCEINQAMQFVASNMEQ